MERYGIIDLGSNSVRMNIVNVYKNGSYSLVDQAKVMVRLSEGLSDGGMLRQEPINRTLEAIKLFKRLITSYGVTRVVAVATAAVRQASNAQVFLDGAKAMSGIEFKVISGYEEARYDFLGVINTIDVPDFLMIDTGGGSTELAWVVNRRILDSVSLPFGSVILTERFLNERFLNEKERAKGIDKAEKFIKKAYKEVLWLKETKGLPIIGLGGSLRTVAKAHRGRQEVSSISLHNYRMTKDELMAVLGDLIKTPPDKVSDLPGVGKDRSDIIAGGVLPLKVLMEQVGGERFIASGNGLREGLFFEKYFTEKSLPVVVPSVLEHSLINVRKRFNVDNAHTDHVRKLSLTLYDALAPLGRFELGDRRLLDAASQLHDIGMHIEYYNHHRHGFYLILNARLCGLTNDEIIKVAFLVGSHRDTKLKEDLERYRLVLDKETQDRLRRLAIFLQFAEKLDRSESGVVESIDVMLEEVGNKTEAVRLRLFSSMDTELECVAAGRLADDFEKLFGLKMRVVRG
jgi:exopolyphosphatase/guanosine-5'-triphosphate,3'-diphosphate pyrophosphatase